MAELLTKKNEKIVYVPNNLMIELERSWYEYEGLRTLLAQFASDSPLKPDQARFEYLVVEYIKSFSEYNIIFNQIAYMYVDQDDRAKNLTASFELSAFLVSQY